MLIKVDLPDKLGNGASTWFKKSDTKKYEKDLFTVVEKNDYTISRPRASSIDFWNSSEISISNISSEIPASSAI
jgi:hypothetical protein